MAVFMHFRKEGKMSRIYDKYLELKKKDHEKLYLFHCGNFYIFLDEDAEQVNNYVVLKRTKFTRDIMKCGFPIGSKDEYLKVFHNQNLNVEVIENPLLPEDVSERERMILDQLKKIHVEEITPLEALSKLKELQEMCYES